MIHVHYCCKENPMSAGVKCTLQPATLGRADDYDLALLRRVAAGDPQAFEMLYYQYARRLTAYLAKMLWPTDQVEDVLHDVLIAIWQQAPAYQPTGRVSAWIFGIAHHKACKARTAAARQAPQQCPARPTAPAEA